MKRLHLSYAFILFSLIVSAQPTPDAGRIIIVTLDGFRWQELFRGADEVLLHNSDYFPNQDSAEYYDGKDIQKKRQKLLPFFWSTIASRGQLYGNRDIHSYVNCSNPYWFSYPGYHELFVGAVNRKVCSNVKIKNPNSTVLEFLNVHPLYRNSVAAFSTWDAFPFILRESSSGITVNAGLEQTGFNEILTDNERKLNQRLKETNYRTDSITFFMGFEYLKKNRPRVLYIAFDETDHGAHRARYDEYLNAARRSDAWISELWSWVESDPEYAGRTTLLITTDHGRGRTLRKSWRHHGRFTFGSGQIWMAALGAGVPATGEVEGGSQLYQKQIAGTIAALLGLNYSNEFAVGDVIQTMIQPSVFIARKRNY